MNEFCINGLEQGGVEEGIERKDFTDTLNINTSKPKGMVSGKNCGNMERIGKWPYVSHENHARIRRH